MASHKARKAVPKLSRWKQFAPKLDQSNWKIDAIAVGSSGELAISGHNMDENKTFLSVFKSAVEKSKPDSTVIFRGEFNYKVVEFIDSGDILIIGNGQNIKYYDTKELKTLKTIDLPRKFSQMSFTENLLYLASDESHIVMKVHLKSEKVSEIHLTDIMKDYVLDIQVIKDVIYICTKNTGKALAYSTSSSIEKTWERTNALDFKDTAKSICVQEENGLILVLWNRTDLSVYSTKRFDSVLDLQIKESDRIRITKDNKLWAVNEATCIINVYDMSDITNFIVLTHGSSKKTLSAKKLTQLTDLCEKLLKQNINFQSRINHTEALYDQSKREIQDLKKSSQENNVKWKKAIEELRKLKLENELRLKGEIEAYKLKVEELKSKQEEDLSLKKQIKHINKAEIVAVLEQLKEEKKNSATYEKETTYEQVVLPSDRLAANQKSSLEYQKSLRPIPSPVLKVAKEVSHAGAHLEIADTGIELRIPPGSLEENTCIEMNAISSEAIHEPVKTFSSNSSVIIELLPDRFTFKSDVQLVVPHCLNLQRNFQKNCVTVYCSHHETGKYPVWEEVHDAQYELEQDRCILFLRHCCWIKFEINDQEVEAKRIKVFACPKELHPNDAIAEVTVGFCLDLPGSTKVLPKGWQYPAKDNKPKAISFKTVADSKQAPCDFIFHNEDGNDHRPFCMFQVSQGNEVVYLNVRF